MNLNHRVVFATLAVVAWSSMSVMSVEEGIVTCAKKSGKASHFYSIADTTMEIAYFEEQNLTSFDCASQCRGDSSCLSYSYSKRLEMCRLFEYDRETGPEFLVTSSEYHYYDTVETKTSNSRYLGTCRYNQCQNGGACRTDCSQRGYYCVCPDGYRGEFCQRSAANQPELVQTLRTDLVRATAAFTYDNMHFIATGTSAATDSSGSTVQGDHVIYRFNYDTDQYESFQSLSGSIGVSYGLSAFQLTGKQYLFGCNYRDYGGSHLTSSSFWVYDNSTDSFVIHQTLSTKGCLYSPYVRTADNDFYIFLAYYYDSSSYDVDSEIYKWYPRYERFVLVDTIATKGVYQPFMYDIDSVAYVAIPNFRDSSGFEVSAEVWKRSDTYDLYRGCYIDSDPRALDGEYFQSSSITISACITFCRDRGYPSAGLQSSSWCFCGDEDYDEYGAASDCNQQCAGDSSNYCGGSWRNSVYATDPSWSLLQSLPESTSGSVGMYFYEHGGSQYLAMASLHDASVCDKDTIVYVWNAGTDEWEIHQRISFTLSCTVNSKVFERNGEKFMISVNLRKYRSSSGGDDQMVTCRVFKLTGTMWVDYTTLEGASIFNVETFERDGEFYIAMPNGRTETGFGYSDVPLNIYKWV